VGVDDDRERFEERAAIIQYDGGYPRATAEAMARRQIQQARERQQQRDLFDPLYGGGKP
jgi:hypothetical protein